MPEQIILLLQHTDSLCDELVMRSAGALGGLLDQHPQQRIARRAGAAAGWRERELVGFPPFWIAACLHGCSASGRGSATAADRSKESKHRITNARCCPAFLGNGAPWVRGRDLQSARTCSAYTQTHTQTHAQRHRQTVTVGGLPLIP